MERTLVRLAGPAVLALTLLAAGAQSPPAVEAVSIVPSTVSTRVVLRTSIPPALLLTSYTAAVSPAELRLEFGPCRWPELPGIPGGETLLHGLREETLANARTVLVLTLAEKVPYRIFPESGTLIIELEKIQRGSGAYAIAPQIELALSAAASRPAELRAPTFSEKDGRLEVAARLGRPALTNVFALDNPLRLVVDIFDADYIGPTETRPVGRYGIESIRVGQFMAGDPYTITRLVFDLAEAGLFSLAATADGLRIGFGDGGAASVGTETKAYSENAPAGTTAPPAASIQPPPPARAEDAPAKRKPRPSPANTPP